MSVISEIIFDSKIDQIIRSFNKGDNILYTYGIDNLVFGIIRVSFNSEQDDAVKMKESFEPETLKRFLPLGLYLNGVIAIYNENTFEDFDGILNEQVEKLKEINKNLGITNEEINYIQLAIKEILYLDDDEEYNWELKKINDNQNDDLIIKFEDNLIANEELVKLLICRINILFNNNNNNDGTELKIKSTITNDELESLILSEKNKKIILKIEDMLINEDEFDSKLSYNDLKSVNYNNIHINKLKGIKISLGNINNQDKEIFINNLIIEDIDCNIKNTNIYLEDLIVLKKDPSNGINKYKELLSKLLERLCKNLKIFLDNMNTNNKINESVILYNKLFSTFPLIVESETQIKISKETQGNPELVITDNINNSQIKNLSILKEIYNIKGLSLYKFVITNLNDVNDNSTKEIQNNISSLHIENPHLSVPKILDPPSDTHTIRQIVSGDYKYYHYNQDNFNDAGWGCAYRSFQTVFSWFIENTSVGKGKKIPTINEIQKKLVEIGDKDKSILDSNKWIGAIEVNLLLNEFLGIDNQILYVSSGSEMKTKGRELIYHFKHNKAPVMIGGGVFAYTILGVDYDKVKGECKFLILDPHYIGEDNVDIVVNKGWCNWKNDDLFKKECFYNLCMPSIY